MKCATHIAFAIFAAGLFTNLPLAHAADAKSKPAAPKLRAYTLPICVVSGQKLEADAYTFKYEDREIKTCCDQCMDDFYKDPAGYVEKIEAAEKKVKKK